MKKRFLALLLALTLLLSLVPAAWAEGEDTDAGPGVTDVAPGADEETPEEASEETPEEPEETETPETPEASETPSVPETSSPEDFLVIAGQLRNYTGSAREVFIPEGVTYIGSSAFHANTAMEILHVPYTVMRIDQPTLNTLSETNLKTLYVDNPISTDIKLVAQYLPNVTVITPPEYAQFTFREKSTAIAEYHGPGGDVVIPKGTTRFDYVFQGNTAITSVTIPDTVTSISQGAFSGCWNLKTINAPDRLKAGAEWELAHKDFKIIQSTRIEEYVGPGGDVFIPADITDVYYTHPLARREDITSITFSPEAKKISEDFFQDCKGLRKVTAPESAGLTLKHFYGCTSMTDEGLPAYLRSQPQFILEGTTLVRYEGYKADVVIPEGVTEIAARAFDSYKHYAVPISSITLPSTLTTLNDCCFSNCYSAKKVVLPDGLDLLAVPYSGFDGLGEDTLVVQKGKSQSIRDFKPQWQAELTGKKQEEAQQQQQEAAKNRVQELWDNAYDSYKSSPSYLKSLEENRAFIRDFTKPFNYKYTLVTDDIRALSNQLSKGLTSDYDKVMAFHDWAIENVYYDYEAYYGGKIHSYLAQEVLDGRKAVCNGYANLIQALCWAQNIPAIHVSGIAGGAHAWNLIRLDGTWKWMDATWDTFNGYYGGDQWNKGETRYDYCLCPSEFISTDHTARSTFAMAGVNVEPLAYYGILLEQQYPNTILYNSEIDGKRAFEEKDVDTMNRMRAEEGLAPVKYKTYHLYYPGSPGYDDPAEATPPEGVQVTGPIDPEEEIRLLEEEYNQEVENNHLAELKKRAQDPTLRNAPVNTDLYPDSWALDEVIAAIEAELVPADLQNKYGQAITRLDFCRLMVRLVEKSGKSLPAAGKNPFTDVNSTEVTVAYQLGIVKGVGGDKFNPSGSITRIEAATMLGRTANLLGCKAGQSESFTDADTFADWGREGILLVSGLKDATTGNKVMQGTGGGAFSPLMTYSREQAILTALRIFRCK